MIPVIKPSFNVSTPYRKIVEPGKGHVLYPLRKGLQMILRTLPSYHPSLRMRCPDSFPKAYQPCLFLVMVSALLQLTYFAAHVYGSWFIWIDRFIQTHADPPVNYSSCDTRIARKVPPLLLHSLGYVLRSPSLISFCSQLLPLPHLAKLYYYCTKLFSGNIAGAQGLRPSRDCRGSGHERYRAPSIVSHVLDITHGPSFCQSS